MQYDILLVTRLFHYNPLNRAVEPDRSLDYVLDSGLEFWKHGKTLRDHYLAGVLLTITYNGEGEAFVTKSTYVSHTNCVTDVRELSPGEKQALTDLAYSLHGKSLEYISRYPIEDIAVGPCVTTKSGSHYVIGLPLLDDRIHDTPIFKTEIFRN